MSDRFEGFTPMGSFAGKPFWQCLGPAKHAGLEPCQTKICLVATDLVYLEQVLRGLLDREDCFGVKLSEGDRDGMHLGRCFLTDARAVGEVVAQLKRDPKLMVTCQDDTFFLAFRSNPAG